MHNIGRCALLQTNPDSQAALVRTLQMTPVRDHYLKRTARLSRAWLSDLNGFSSQFDSVIVSSFSVFMNAQSCQMCQRLVCSILSIAILSTPFPSCCSPCTMLWRSTSATLSTCATASVASFEKESSERFSSNPSRACMRAELRRARSPVDD